METISEQREVKAKKEHNCNFCDEKIRVGEVYTKATFSNDGEIYDWKTHLRCDKLAHDLNLYEESCGDGISCDDFMNAVKDKYKDVILSKIPKDLQNQLSECIDCIPYIEFNHKVFAVIKFLNKKRKH